MSRRIANDTTLGVLRPGLAADAPALHALLEAHLVEGRLLPRGLDDLIANATRFVVIEHNQRLIGCAELAPLSPSVAEVRSLVVDAGARGAGLARRMVDALSQQARRQGFAQLCAFAHDAGFFVRLGFSIVPHARVPEKIARDCVTCSLFGHCDQHALVLPLQSVMSRERVAARLVEAQVLSHAS